MARYPLQFGKYLLLERVNVGGMAEVFKAKTFGVAGFEKLVAIKRILPTMVEDEEFIRMFIDEARISVQLNHANIITVHELGRHGEAYYIAMEYLPSRDLRAILDRLRQSGTLMPTAQAAFIASKICDALDYAHRKKDLAGHPLNIIHRDVSPQNVLVGFEGEVKVIDFGIAKAAGRASKTQAGVLKGKFGYMSPEQVRGLEIDRRSDLFAVGVLLYEMLTGERLFIGESDFSTLERVRNAEVAPPTLYNKKINRELEAIVLKALAREVEDRYQWASDLAEDLQRFLIEDRSIYSSKRLAAYMKEVYTPEIAAEQAKMEEYLKVPAPEDVDPEAARPERTHIFEASSPDFPVLDRGGEDREEDGEDPGEPDDGALEEVEEEEYPTEMDGKTSLSPIPEELSERSAVPGNRGRAEKPERNERANRGGDHAERRERPDRSRTGQPQVQDALPARSDRSRPALPALRTPDRAAGEKSRQNVAPKSSTSLPGIRPALQPSRGNTGQIRLRPSTAAVGKSSTSLEARRTSSARLAAVPPRTDASRNNGTSPAREGPRRTDPVRVDNKVAAKGTTPAQPVEGDDPSATIQMTKEQLDLSTQAPTAIFVNPTLPANGAKPEDNKTVPLEAPVVDANAKTAETDLVGTSTAEPTPSRSRKAKGGAAHAVPRRTESADKKKMLVWVGVPTILLLLALSITVIVASSHPSVGSVRVTAKGEIPVGLKVVLDGLTVAEVLPVDFYNVKAGQHTLTASGQGIETYHQAFELAAGQTKAIEVELVAKPEPKPVVEPPPPAQPTEPTPAPANCRKGDRKCQEQRAGEKIEQEIAPADGPTEDPGEGPAEDRHVTRKEDRRSTGRDRDGRRNGSKEEKRNTATRTDDRKSATDAPDDRTKAEEKQGASASSTAPPAKDDKTAKVEDKKNPTVIAPAKDDKTAKVEDKKNTTVIAPAKDDKTAKVEDKKNTTAPAPAATGGATELRINTKPSAQVFVDGKDTKEWTPINLKPLKLSSGKHVFLFQTREGAKYKYEATLQPGEVKLIIKELGKEPEPRPGLTVKMLE